MRKLSEKSLGNVALHYLRKHSASRKGLVQLLERKIKREGEVPLNEARALIDQVVARMEQDGYLDDARMAEAKTASLHRQGKSSRVIERMLRGKGIDAALAKKSASTTPEVELESACLLVKRKRLGVDPARKQKDLAVLMRAGFRSDVARRALETAEGARPGAGSRELPSSPAPAWRGVETKSASRPGSDAASGTLVAFPGSRPGEAATAPREGEACKVLQLPLAVRALPEPEPEADADLEDAGRLVEKKRLGLDPARKQRDLAVLVRAGFTWDVAKRALARD